MSVLQLLLTFVASASAFAPTGTVLRAAPKLARPAVAMSVPLVETMPTLLTAAEADISPVFLASATGGLLFLALIVGTVVTNFGVMKK